jgi:hypothetical protein
MLIRLLLGLVLSLCSCALRAQLSPITWPLATGEATPSDKYEIYVSHGTTPEVRLDVLMSLAIADGDFAASELAGRTFSFAWLHYRPDGAPLRFRVVKKFGTASSAVQIAPRRLEFSPALAAPNEATFTVDATERYFSVHFVGPDKPPRLGLLKEAGSDSGARFDSPTCVETVELHYPVQCAARFYLPPPFSICSLGPIYGAQRHRSCSQRPSLR